MNFKICFKMHSIYLFFYILIIFTNFIVSKKMNCLQNPDGDFCRMSFNEPYKYIANLNDSGINLLGCEAEKIWLFIRYGTKLPDTKFLEQMKQLSILRDNILKNCNSDKGCLNYHTLKALRNWRPEKIPEDEADTLTEEGENELIGIAKRYQTRFPGLMPKEYSNDTYRFKATNSKRTRESGKAFAIGLFGEEEAEQVQFPESDDIDLVLQPYRACDKWSEKIMKNGSTFEEYEKFKISPIARSMLHNIYTRTRTEFNFNEVVAMYLTCTSETARNRGNPSPWCLLLDSKDLKIMEFAADLITYYTSGNAYKVTSKLACPTLVDFFDFIRSENTVKASVYFGNSEAISKILTLLGFGRDEKRLRHNSFKSAQKRTWRMSLIDGSASNIAFIYFDCGLSNPEIVFMHQERIVSLPGCPQGYSCRLSKMEQLFPDNDDECKFDELCSL